MGSDDDDEAIVLCPDTHGLVHIVFANGSWRRSICAMWGRGPTFQRLLWRVRDFVPFPTCVSCVYYADHARQMHGELSARVPP